MDDYNQAENKEWGILTIKIQLITILTNIKQQIKLVNCLFNAFLLHKCNFVLDGGAVTLQSFSRKKDLASPTFILCLEVHNL